MKFFRFELTPGFVLLAAWLNYMDRQGIVPLFLVSCAAHELGHCAAIWWFGGKIRQFKLSAIGAEILLDASLGYVPEGIIALSGPGINLCLAVLFSWLDISFVFSGINLVLGCFNLLPLRLLDGGRALYCMIALLMGTNLAEKIISVLNKIGLLFFAAFGSYICGIGRNYTMIFIIIWLIAGEIGKKDVFRSCQRE